MLVTKTRSGESVAVPFVRPDETICPVRLLRAWLATSEITEGPLFRRIDRNGCIGIKALIGPRVTNVVKQFAERAGLDPKLFAGRSLRAGFATSAAAAGKSLHDVMRQRRHGPERMAMSYTPAERGGTKEPPTKLGGNPGPPISRASFSPKATPHLRS
jgi:hypothetical protein